MLRIMTSTGHKIDTNTGFSFISAKISMLIKVTLASFILASLLCPSVSFSPWMVRRLRRTVEIRRQHEAAKAQDKPKTDDHRPTTLGKLEVRNLAQVWRQERERLKRYEYGTVDERNVTSLVRAGKKPQHFVNVEFKEKEKYRHDSLLNEIVHSIDTDAYLAL